MTTPRTQALVSLVTMMTFTLGLGACIGGPSHRVVDTPAPVDRASLTIRFDNGAREHVHVYLVGEQREWLLGRVEPGAIATFHVPEASLRESTRFVRLAVIAGASVTQSASRDPRAMLTIAQPVGGLLSQQWSYANGQLTLLRGW